MKLTLDNLKTGNRKASYSGKNNKGNPNPAGKIKYNPPTTRSKTKLNREDVEVAEFEANNVDRRGNRSKLEFRGNHPHRWNPAQDFDPNRQGYVADGGAFKGGRPGNKKGGKKDYAKAFGDVKDTTRPFANGNVERHVRFKVKK